MKEPAKPQLVSAMSSDPRWELACRVAASPSFKNCPKLRAFLLYVAENALLGQPENIREQLIGSRVFGRSPDYNLGEDNIVRVEARELRKRLAAYFSTEGKDEPETIEVPKGGYLPVFRSRQEPPPPVPEAQPRGRKWLVPVLAAAFLALAAAVLLLVADKWRAQPKPQEADASMYSDLLGTLGRVANRETLVVLSNPKVVLYFASQSEDPGVRGAGRIVPAPAQLNRTFREALNNQDQNLPHQFLQSTNQDYTGMGEAVAAFHAGRLMQSLGRPVRLTQGRFLDWDHMPKQDLILLGGPQINDWTLANVGKSNFNMVSSGVENAHPLEGEQKLYAEHYEPGSSPGVAVTGYGVVKMQTSPYGFRMLLIAGTSSAATGGAGEFFASPAKMKPLYERLRTHSRGKPFPPDWELLLRIHVRDGLPIDSTALALRPGAPR